jgi:hypothetical protein
MDYNGFYYLSSKSSLHHEYHTYIPPEAISRSTADLDDQEQDFMNTLVNLHASHKLITQVFENLKGASFGTFLPKSIYYMNQKSEQILDLAQGISSDMSDAQKTLKKLDLYVYCHLIFCLSCELTHSRQASVNSHHNAGVNSYGASSLSLLYYCPTRTNIFSDMCLYFLQMSE